MPVVTAVSVCPTCGVESLSSGRPVGGLFGGGAVLPVPLT